MKAAQKDKRAAWALLFATIGLGLGAVGLGAYHSYREAQQAAGRAEMPPDHLTISGERWYLEADPELDKLTHRAAETDCRTNHINYDTSLSAALLREALWHEIYHAELCKKHVKVYEGFIIFEPGMPVQLPSWQSAVDGEEHDVIYPLAMAQATFMHDNPEFVRWATQW